METTLTSNRMVWWLGGGLLLGKVARHRQVLLRIAEDEARHAELSWRFVGWALSQGGSKLRAAVRKAFDCAKGELAQSVQQSTATDIELLDHGVLSPERRTRLALEVFATVIGPCADALLVEHRLEAGSEVLQSSA